MGKLTKKMRSWLVKRARAGKKVAGGGFAKLAAKAAKFYGSKESGRRVAAKVMWNLAKKYGVSRSGKIKKR